MKLAEMGRFGTIALGAALAAGLMVMGTGCAGESLSEGSTELADIPAESVLSSQFAAGGQEMKLGETTFHDFVVALGSKAHWEEADLQSGTYDGEGEDIDGDAEPDGETEEEEQTDINILEVLNQELPAGSTATLSFSFGEDAENPIYRGDISMTNGGDSAIKLADCRIDSLSCSAEEDDAVKPTEAGFPTVQVGTIQLGSSLDDVYATFGDPTTENNTTSEDNVSSIGQGTFDYNFQGGNLSFVIDNDKVVQFTYAMPEEIDGAYYAESLTGVGDENSFAKQIRKTEVNPQWYNPLVANTTLGGHKVDYNIVNFAAVNSWNLGKLEIVDDTADDEATAFEASLTGADGQELGVLSFVAPTNEGKDKNTFVLGGFNLTETGLPLLNVDGLNAGSPAADVLAKFGRPSSRTGSSDADATLSYDASFIAGPSEVYMDASWSYNEGKLASVSVSTSVSPIEEDDSAVEFDTGDEGADEDAAVSIEGTDASEAPEGEAPAEETPTEG